VRAEQTPAIWSGQLTQKELAELFGITARQLRRWRTKKYVAPVCGTSGRARGYPPDEVARLAKRVFERNGAYDKNAARRLGCAEFLENLRLQIADQQADIDPASGKVRRHEILIEVLAGGADAAICTRQQFTRFEVKEWRALAERCLGQIAASPVALRHLANAVGTALMLAAVDQPPAPLPPPAIPARRLAKISLRP
jgi:DNA-binding transcriptional MerR regulator